MMEAVGYIEGAVVEEDLVRIKVISLVADIYRGESRPQGRCETAPTGMGSLG
jgi:hypothetical protein